MLSTVNESPTSANAVTGIREKNISTLNKGRIKVNIFVDNLFIAHFLSGIFIVYRFRLCPTWIVLPVLHNKPLPDALALLEILLFEPENEPLRNFVMERFIEANRQINTNSV
jgi:hypothetical protein